MHYRAFGNTDLKVSEIGFGAWAIGGGAMIGNTAIGWGDADDALSRRAIHAALDQGINFFDTADIYGLGHSEELLGKTVAREEVIIASKVGNVSRNDQFTVDYSKDHIIKACEASLRRLHREAIDFYQLHTARMPHLLQRECIEAMQVLHKQGKIRYWGLSLNTFEPLEEARHLMEHQQGHGFQLVLNILNQKALPLLQDAHARGYGIIARMPLQFGLLTGKFDRDLDFAGNDHRKNRITSSIVANTLKVTDPVWTLCEQYQCNKTQLALSYVLSYPEVSVVIPGIRTPEQAVWNTQGLFRLTISDRSFIEELGATSFPTLMEQIRGQG